MSDQDATARDGHGIDTGEQRTWRRTDADACSLRHTEREQVGGAAGRTWAFLETAQASSKPCTEKLWSRKQREKRPESDRQHFVLSTRDPLLLPRPPPFIAQEGAVQHSIPTNRILTDSILLGT